VSGGIVEKPHLLTEYLLRAFTNTAFNVIASGLQNCAAISTAQVRTFSTAPLALIIFLFRHCKHLTTILTKFMQ